MQAVEASIENIEAAHHRLAECKRKCRLHYLLKCRILSPGLPQVEILRRQIPLLVFGTVLAAKFTHSCAPRLLLHAL